MQLTYIPLKKEKRFYTWAGIIIVLFTVVATGIVSEFDVTEAIRVLPGVFGFIFTDFLPPNPSAVPDMLPSLLDTFCMAIISTVTSAVISIILALLCATPTMPHIAFKVVIRGFASCMRNIPALAWTLILVPAFGIGKFVGIIALIIGSLGNMTRFFTETIEEIDTGKLEALRSTGGSYWQMLRNAVLPQCVPGIVSWTLYSLELDIRASTIIGMVGGGGIGFFIQTVLKQFRYDEASMAIISVAVFVLLIEFVSKRVREAIM